MSAKGLHGETNVLLVGANAATLAACRGVVRSVLGGSLRIDEASMPDQAVGFLRTRWYDLVLADYHYPSRLTGVDVLEVAARENPGATRVLMTGRPSVDIALDSAMRARVHAFITKPADAETFTRRLARVLAGA